MPIKKCFSSSFNQRGFLLPLALLAIVLIGAVSIFMITTLSSASDSSLRNAISRQAFYLAETGIEWTRYQLSSIEVTERQEQCDQQLMGHVLPLESLELCRIEISCDVIAAEEGNNNNDQFYRIESDAYCAKDGLVVSHGIEVAIKMHSQEINDPLSPEQNKNMSSIIYWRDK